jgi:hypothetical protein
VTPQWFTALEKLFRALVQRWVRSFVKFMLGAEYLGDLDPKGVRITHEFNGASAMTEPRIRPAIDWYRWLLQHGRKRQKPKCDTANKAYALAWLSDGMRGRTRCRLEGRTVDSASRVGV